METSCVAYLNKQKCLFLSFFYKIGEQEGRPGPVWRVGSSDDGGEGMWRKVVGGRI
jgi:hypothetical protein